MTYKTWDEWNSAGEKIQAELNRIDDEFKKARQARDVRNSYRLLDEYDKLSLKMADHMKLRPRLRQHDSPNART